MLGDTYSTIWGDTGSSEGHGGQRTLGQPGSAQTRASCVLSVKSADMSLSASTCWAAHGQLGTAHAARPPGVQSRSSGGCSQEPPGPTPFCPHPPQCCATARISCPCPLRAGPTSWAREGTGPGARSFQTGHHLPTWPSFPVCHFFHLLPPTRAREGGGDISALPLCPNPSSLEAPAGGWGAALPSLSPRRLQRKAWCPSFPLPWARGAPSLRSPHSQSHQRQHPDWNQKLGLPAPQELRFFSVHLVKPLLRI